MTGHPGTAPGEAAAAHRSVEGGSEADPLDPPAGDAALARIPGRALDPPVKPKPAKVLALGRENLWVRVGLGAVDRFTHSRSPVMAAGTAYYGFLAMFSLLAFTYGVASLLNADGIARWLTDTLEESLPGLIGKGGIDPDTLARVGRTTSVLGLVVLLVSGTAVVGAARDSLHRIYGAPPSGHNPLVQRAQLLGWLALLGPLVLVSYSMSTAVTAFGRDLLDALGIDGSATRWLLLAAVAVATFLLDLGISALMLARLGGVEPPRPAVLPGAVVTALVVTTFKVLFVLWFQAMGLYAGGCVTAARAMVAAPRPAPAAA
jgi:uncharacterized BrkB/YihY/UPF0761 family membrane protein